MPLTLTRLPQSRWPRTRHSPPLTVWASDRYQAVLWLQADGQMVLSLARRDRRGNIPWQTLQALKRAAGFGTWQALEVYPPDTAIINRANMRHLWLSHSPQPIGWTK